MSNRRKPKEILFLRVTRRMDTSVENTRILSIHPVISPEELKAQFPNDNSHKISEWRKEIEDIVAGRDKRLLVVVGPCSIHDYGAAICYATELSKLRQRFSSQIYVVMRVYFEKPRTTVGWKGLVNDPNLDGSYDIHAGLRLARALLLEISRLGLPTACEFLDVFTPQYYADLVSWGAIGARTTESQLHRELASGLSMTIGFKNGTDGSVDIATDAIQCARESHVFLGIDTKGQASIVKTRGNSSLHVILRGGVHGPNFDHVNVAAVKSLLHSKKIATKILIDCSHGNSGKLCKNQNLVLESILLQIKNGETAICGVMIESNIQEGAQKFVVGQSTPLIYGKSITDECVNLQTTEKMLESMASTVAASWQ